MLKKLLPKNPLGRVKTRCVLTLPKGFFWYRKNKLTPNKIII
jgi:hypothetical protein